MSVLDAAYAPIEGDRAWGLAVLEALSGVFHRSEGVGVHVVAHDTECVEGRSLLHVGTGAAGAIASIADSDLGALGPTGFRAFFYPPAMVVTHREVDPMLTPDAREIILEQRSAAGLVDAIGIVVHPEPGVSMAVFSALPRHCSPTLHERRLLSQLGLHLEAAFRLRLRPEIVKAVVTLEGSQQRRPDEPPAGEKLTAHARRIESARASGRDGNQEEALDLWTALIAGRYSFVPRVESGARRYLVLENSPDSQAIRALSRREVDVLAMAARGVSTKLVAYGLGLSPAAVSSSLLRTASKLGLASRIELLRLAASLTGDPRARALPATLTAAENEILDLLRQGMSNREIARVRSRSVRTIANQVASLLRKTESPSRRKLVASAASPASFSRR